MTKYFRAKRGQVVIGGKHINAEIVYVMDGDEKSSLAVIHHYGQTLQSTVPEIFPSHDFALTVVRACFPYIDVPDFRDYLLLNLYTKIQSGAFSDDELP
jgi:hypothetical protein